MKKLIGIQPLIHSGSDNLESFLAWSAQIKLDMSESNPLLEQVLENVAFSMHPIAGGGSFRMTGHEARELQIRSEGRQLGCLLVQRTKGETQLQVTKWLSATNGWEAWRQLNLSFLSRLLTSLLQINLDDEQPASCLQPLAWKEHVVEHQELSDTSLNMLAIETCQKEQEELGEHNRVDYQDNSLQQQASLPPREARGSTSFPTAGKELAKPREKSLAKLAEPSEKSMDKEAEKGDKNKEKEKAKLTVPSLKPTKARGSTRSFLHKSFGAATAGRKGTPPKLAGGTPAPSNKSTNRRPLGAARAERSSFKETMETNLLLTGWLPTKVS